MKITRSKLRELVRQAIQELKFGSKAQYDAYKKKHHIKPGTQITVGDKKTTHKGKGKISKAAAKKADKFAADMNAKMDAAEKGSDSGGPSYANVPKGAKSTKQAKLMKKNDSAAKDVGYKNTDDLIKNGNVYEVEEWMNNVPDVGQDFDQAAELLDLVRDNDQGMRDDDQDVIDDYLNKVKKIVNTPSIKEGGPGSGPHGDDEDNPFDREPSDDELKDIEKQFESINEVLDRRVTVKEVKLWMKTLEENRYKKTYNSDARRVAWFVNNNLSEDYESMPISMRKKWDKAAYGRERYLAKEFIKSHKSKMNEIAFRDMIRDKITKLI